MRKFILLFSYQNITIRGAWEVTISYGFLFSVPYILRPCRASWHMFVYSTSFCTQVISWIRCSLYRGWQRSSHLSSRKEVWPPRWDEIGPFHPWVISSEHQSPCWTERFQMHHVISSLLVLHPKQASLQFQLICKFCMKLRMTFNFLSFSFLIHKEDT